jgi:hypothetical protein
MNNLPEETLFEIFNRCDNNSVIQNLSLVNKQFYKISAIIKPRSKCKKLEHTKTNPLVYLYNLLYHRDYVNGII